MTFTYIKNDAGEFVCPTCNAVKKRQNSMHYHMKKHLEELQHMCIACNKGFLQKQTLDLHIRSKHPELLKEEKAKHSCPMENCTFTAITKGNLIIHLLRLHFQDEISAIMLQDNDTKTVTCDACHKVFKSSCSFYYHCKGCITFDKESEKYKTVTHILQ